MYKIKISDNAKEDLARLKKNDQNLFRKATKLLLELSEHPRTGTGQIERLKYYQEETWSRRISKQHRLIYRINDEFVEVLLLSAFGHYNDK
jgi:toxin YoeB